MKKNNKNSYYKGLWAETIAATFLRLKGYKILKKRYQSPMGEIDLIAKRRQKISFIEVKARHTLDEALWSVTISQQKRIGQSAMQWISHHPQFYDFDISFDMILIAPRHFPRHLKNAFSYDD